MFPSVRTRGRSQLTSRINPKEEHSDTSRGLALTRPNAAGANTDGRRREQLGPSAQITQTVPRRPPVFAPGHASEPLAGSSQRSEGLIARRCRKRALGHRFFSCRHRPQRIRRNCDQSAPLLRPESATGRTTEPYLRRADYPTEFVSRGSCTARTTPFSPIRPRGIEAPLNNVHGLPGKTLNGTEACRGIAVPLTRVSVAFRRPICHQWVSRIDARFCRSGHRVLRLAVVWYLVFVTSVGPTAYCCCLANGLHTPAKPVANAEDRPAPPPKKHSCCHAAAAPEYENPARPEAPLETPRPHCPCKSATVVPALPESERDSFESQSLPSGSVAVENLFGHLPAAPPSRSGGDHLNMPFLSARDLLRAHHNLRC